ncbi:MAG: polysaccharide biosynthesis C-terminal domain-containing protein, partial [Actinomycetota bacterium]|nr:polysaccharide biosynthesis C-terminal domain-containing protein [Actinomycetota bacterium]
VLRAFYAHQDARTPFVINAAENVFNIVLALVLYDRFGVIGIAASFAIAYVLSALWSMQVLSYKVSGFELRPVFASLFRITLASAVMAEAVWAVARLVGGNSGAEALLRVGVGGIVGVAVFVGVLVVLQAPEIDELRERFRPAVAQ